MTEKYCKTCDQWKFFSEFHKNKSTKDGHNSQCKSCKKKYHEKNKDRIAKVTKTYYENHKNSISKTHKEYYQKNKEHYAEYREKNRDRRRQIQREYKKLNVERYAQYRKENKKLISEYQRKYVKDNLQRYRTYNAKRMALKKSTITSDPWELDQIRLLYSECPKGWHVDHIIPLNLGGRHELANLQHLEARLNQSKNDKHPDDWNDPRPISCRA